MTRRRTHLKRLARRPAHAQTGSDPGVLFFLDSVIGLLRYASALKGI